MLLYALTIFLSAFLLFQVEPTIAKMILPWFGGSAAVWATCLLFFQLALLLGYLYAFAVVRRLRPKTQARLHVILLALSLALLPIIPGNTWKPSGLEDPSLRILLLLSATIGLPYILLSAASPLLQAWWTRERLSAAPYRLFALSNAGSMLGLLSYPVLVEPFFSTRHQAIGWSLAYAAVAVLCATVALRPANKAVGPEVAGAGVRPAWTLQLLWVALAACGSALLLAVTNHLTQNVAAVPFLWVIPLSLYLLSFILCFGGRIWYRRDLFVKLCALALASMAYALSPESANSRLILLIPLYSAGLFVCCMVCHGELERLKPAPAHLTSFYLMASLGGAVGGLFVGLLAPHVFNGYFELPVTLGAVAVVVLVALHRDATGVFQDAAPWKPAWLVAAGLCALFIASLVVQVRRQTGEARAMVRNFYGSLQVIDVNGPDVEHEKRKLMNGTIQHGSQFLEATRRRLPTTYYGPESGVGLALTVAGEHGGIRVGVIGLGAGTLAAYGRQGDHYTFYEINPLVVELANTQFTFLKDCPAKVDIVPGDARLSLEREPPQNFDVLAVDAFTSDSIPIHLLTRQAFELYFRHIRPYGILAVHVSNRHLDLRPVAKGVAASLGKPAVVVKNEDDQDHGVFESTWVLVSDRRDFLDQATIETELDSPFAARPRLQVWTDDYSNLLRVLK